MCMANARISIFKHSFIQPQIYGNEKAEAINSKISNRKTFFKTRTPYTQSNVGSNATETHPTHNDATPNVTIGGVSFGAVVEPS